MSGWFATGTGHLDSVIKQIDLVFPSAAAKGPAIVFLDEIEGIPNRATMSERMPIIGHRWWGIYCSRSTVPGQGSRRT